MRRAPYWIPALTAVAAVIGFIHDLHFLALIAALSSAYQVGMGMYFIEKYLMNRRDP